MLYLCWEFLAVCYGRKKIPGLFYFCMNFTMLSYIYELAALFCTSVLASCGLLIGGRGRRTSDALFLAFSGSLTGFLI